MMRSKVRYKNPQPADQVLISERELDEPVVRNATRGK